ncbi:hypothetical protein VTO42DRAFT_6609 [Malbranchea cinnamomea]
MQGSTTTRIPHDAGAASPPSRQGLALADIPLALLRAELERRAALGSDSGSVGGALVERADDAGNGTDADDGSTCGSERVGGSYNTPVHVAALFLILILSTFACSFPIIARRFPRLPIPRRFLFLSRHFGTGVLIATAFVHLLPTAFVSLTDPCLPSFWNKGYPATAGLVAMLGVMFVVGIEMFFALRGAGHVHGANYDSLIDHVGLDGPNIYQQPYADADAERGEMGVEMDTTGPNGHLTTPRHRYQGSESSGNLMDGVNPLFSKHRRQQGRTHAHDDDDDDHTDSSSHSDLDLQELEPSPLPHPPIPPPPAPPPNPQKQLLQCLLLEAGILFHSVFIGMALSVATGASFAVLLVAISFHQTFEGFALGARISALIPNLFPASSPKPWLMALAYGATTPLGQALGLGLHNLYDPASTTGLLMVGFTNAFSSGLLLFAGLVELLAEDLLSEKSLETLRGRPRLEACGAVAAGAMLMAAVGAFA